MAKVPERDVLRATKRRKGFLDFDGALINPGRNYRTYKALDKLKKEIRMGGECPHPAVMLTARCQCCQHVSVFLRKSMLKS